MLVQFSQWPPLTQKKAQAPPPHDQVIFCRELPDSLHVPLLHLGASKIASDKVNLSCLISYYSLKMYHPSLNLARVMQSRVIGMLLTYLHASRHGTDTYLAYDCCMAFELVKYQTVMVMLFTNHSSACCLEYAGSTRQVYVIRPCAGTPLKRTYMSGPSCRATKLAYSNFSRTSPLFMTNSQYQLALGHHQPSQAKQLHPMPHTLQKAKKSASGI